MKILGPGERYVAAHRSTLSCELAFAKADVRKGQFMAAFCLFAFGNTTVSSLLGIGHSRSTVPDLYAEVRSSFSMPLSGQSSAIRSARHRGKRVGVAG